MSRSDYAHHNEEQDRIWWEEEGKHANEPNDDWDDDSWRDEPEDDEEDETDD